jgi:hypothetical protein
MSSAICRYGGSSRRTFRAISESLHEINVSVLIHPPRSPSAALFT